MESNSERNRVTISAEAGQLLVEQEPAFCDFIEPRGLREVKARTSAARGAPGSAHANLRQPLLESSSATQPLCVALPRPSHLPRLQQQRSAASNRNGLERA